MCHSKDVTTDWLQNGSNINSTYRRSKKEDDVRPRIVCMERTASNREGANDNVVLSIA